MEITGHTVEKVEDPFGILSGERYEFFLDMEVPEDDELFSEQGIKIKVLYIVDENQEKIAYYHIIENNTKRVLEFQLEEDEEQMIEAYCRSQIQNEA